MKRLSGKHVQGYEIYNVNIQVDIVESASRKVQYLLY